MTKKKQSFWQKSYLLFNIISFQLDRLSPTTFQHFDASLVISFVKASKVAIGFHLTFSFDENLCPWSHLIKFGNRKKSLGAKSEEQGESGSNSKPNSMIFAIAFIDLRAGPLSCKKIHFFFNKRGPFLVISSFNQSNNAQ